MGIARQDPFGAAGAGHLRASDAEREQVIDTLKTAFVQGRLSRDELDARAGQALESRTYAELSGAVAGIPPRAVPASPAPHPAAPARGRPVNRKALGWGLGVIILSPALGVAFLATFYGGFIILLFLAFIGATVAGAPTRPADDPRRVA